MFNVKKKIFTLKNKKKLNFISFIILIFLFIYFCIPKLLNFSTGSIKENLKINNNINIKNILKVNYKIFPTPRLSIPNSNFKIGEGIIEARNSDIEIILNISQILNYKKINYKKILIINGNLEFNFDNIDTLLDNIIKNKKNLTLKKNNLIFFQKEKVFFEINDTHIKINQVGEKKKLNIRGNFLGNKIFIKLESKLKNKNNLTVKIPKLDITVNTFFEKNNSNDINGFFNLEVFNNFLKFNFTKENNIKLTNGFVRTKILNSPVEGEVILKPNFYANLTFKPSDLNAEKLFSIVQKIFFSSGSNSLPLTKKINGIFIFKSKFEGKIINRNGEILFENFKVGKDKSYHFNASIIEHGAKGKIKFNLATTAMVKNRSLKKIKIIGFLIPSNSKVIFEKFFIDGNELSIEKTKEYQNEFKDIVIQDSLGNIFDEAKIKKFFKNSF